MTYYINKMGESTHTTKHNIDEAVEEAERLQSQVYILNAFGTGLTLVYSYGEKKALSNVK